MLKTGLTCCTTMCVQMCRYVFVPPTCRLLSSISSLGDLGVTNQCPVSSITMETQKLSMDHNISPLL